MSKVSILIFLSTSVLASFVMAGSCCISSLQVPSLLLGPEVAKISISQAVSETLYRAEQNASWTPAADRQVSSTQKIDGGFRFQNDFQIGASLGFMQSVSQEGGNNLTDSSLSFAWGSFKTLFYSSILIPTGRSIYDQISADNFYTGQGFWGLGLGVLSVQRLKFADFSGGVFVQDRLSRSTQFGPVDPGPLLQVSLNALKSYSEFKLGASLSHSHDQGVESQGEKRVTGFGLTAVFEVNAEDGLQLNYSDQTLFGKPTNSDLQRSWALAFRRQWN